MEITTLRAETSTTYANPDGTLTEESTTGPIRVKSETGVWQNVDTTLVFRDGSVQPKQAAAGIRFSDGGVGPLAEVTEGARALGLGWDGQLPRPTLHGNSATYKNVGPDTDLVVTALPEGFSHLLVLNERPKEQVELRIPVVAEGLRLRETADERLLWESKDGRDVAAAPVPVMWGADEHANTREPAKVSDVAASVEGSGDAQTLVLKPDAAFLDNPEVTYPVTVDPTNTLLGPVTDTWIQGDDYPTSQRGSTELKAGTYNGTERARAYLKFDTTRFLGKQVLDADLRLFSYWSSSCSTDNAGIQVRRVTSDWDPSAISWASQPATTTAVAPVSKVAKGYSASCPAGNVEWDVNGIVQAWAAGQPNYGVRLAAVDETDPLTWRRYRSANYVDGSHDAASEPSLIVTYNSAPAIPTGLTTSPVRADTSVTTTASPNPAFHARVTDSDPGSLLTAEFQVAPDPAYADTTVTWTGRGRQVTSGSVSMAQLSTVTGLPEGAHLQVRARTYDGVDTSSWSGWTTFRVAASAELPADLPQQLQAGATDTGSPLISGVVSSPNGGMVEAQFRISNAAGTQTLGAQLVPNGERAGFQVPAVALASGGPHTWSMRACYTGKCSAWTSATPIKAGSGAPPSTTDASASVSLPLTQATVCTDSDACVGDTTGSLKVGSVSGKNWRSYVKADVSKIPADGRVISATLQLQSTSTSPALAVHALNGAWATTGTGADLDRVTAPGVNVDATAPWTIDVTGLVTGWTDGANGNHGLVLRKPDGAPSTAGVTFTGATLTVAYEAATPPSAPVDPQARPGDGGALVTWGASTDSGYDDTLLTYQVSAVDATGATVSEHTTHRTDAVITGLQNGTSYTFQIRASSRHGTSDTVSSNPATPLSAPLATATYQQAVTEYLAAAASLTTGASKNGDAALAGRPNSALYTWLLNAEEPGLIDTRDALRAEGLTYTHVTSALSDVLALPEVDGSVTLRASVREKKTAADAPGEPEESEAPFLYDFSTGANPQLRSKVSASSFEQRLASDDSVFGTVAYGTIENDGPDATTAPRPAPEPASPPSPDEEQYGPFGTINMSGTATWARAHWNDRGKYGQDCTNFISEALHYGGGMRMKGYDKDRTSVNTWWRKKYIAPIHSGGGTYFIDSHTWTVADKMRQFLSRHSNGAVYQESHQKYAKVGDIVFFNWGGQGGWDHAGVITKMANGKAYVSAHTNNRLNYRLDSYVQSHRGTWADIIRVRPEWY
ncbi:DNRLRE domain-containing protein [Streptomyces sp. NPDC014870]|uniref:DNRLRE domain-containing protein n=1 Tax=Streptomyces sp. NPDC014870 TaxID=3364925 RepID=UPI0036FE8974